MKKSSATSWPSRWLLASNVKGLKSRCDTWPWGNETPARDTAIIQSASAATLKVLQGGPLDAKDKFSFDDPPIASQQDWESLLEKTWSDAENLALAIEQMPESQLWEHFVDEKWGNYYRCIHGPIEHCHYHLGQIAMLKASTGGRFAAAHPLPPSPCLPSPTSHTDL